MYATLILLLCLGLGGCLSLEERVEALNARQVASCIYTLGFPFPFTVVRTVTASGGARLEDCREWP